MSVWVEMPFNHGFLFSTMSRSTWACELKFRDKVADLQLAQSRSTWACELKFLHSFERLSTEYSHAPRERVSWNQRGLIRWLMTEVTLHVSVWVEILDYVYTFNNEFVTLHVSVWVEIINNIIQGDKLLRHAPRERVSWNLGMAFIFAVVMRHAPRERVSWNRRRNASSFNGRASRSTWACELKWLQVPERLFGECHAPRERVSWNVSLISTLVFGKTSRSTWACELKWQFFCCCHVKFLVTLHVSVWVEILNACDFHDFVPSRSTWACELK